MSQDVLRTNGRSPHREGSMLSLEEKALKMVSKVMQDNMSLALTYSEWGPHKERGRRHVQRV